MNESAEAETMEAVVGGERETMEAVVGGEREPIPQTPTESLESDLSEIALEEEPATWGTEDRDVSREENQEASDEDQEASDEDRAVVTAHDEPELTTGDGSPVTDNVEPLGTVQDESPVSDRDSSAASDTPERDEESSLNDNESGTEPVEEADQSEESDWGDANGTEPVSDGRSAKLNLSETEPAENSDFDADAGENVDDAAVRGLGVTVTGDAASPAASEPDSLEEDEDQGVVAPVAPQTADPAAEDTSDTEEEGGDSGGGGQTEEPIPQGRSSAPVMPEPPRPAPRPTPRPAPRSVPSRSEIVPVETISALERRIIPPLTPDSLSPGDGGDAEDRLEDRTGHAEDRTGDAEGLEKTRVGVDSGLVSEHDQDMRQADAEDMRQADAEEPEVVADEERRVQEENTINELRSKTVSTLPPSTVKEEEPEAAAPQSGRRLIKADPSLAAPCSTTFDDDDDDDTYFSETPATPHCPEPSSRGGLGLGYRTGGTVTGTGISTGISTSSTSSHWQAQNMALDLATQRVSFKSDRRHTLCEPPMSRSRPGSSLSTRSSGSDEAPLPNQPGSHVASELQRQFLASSQWTDMDCLSLTLNEVVHIRSVLAKAELDSLPVECHIKEDVARGKLCFLCMKTRFSFFGAKGNNCRLCQQVVCAKCCAKMRIPTEHFASIPVCTLTPSSLSPQEEEARSLLSRLQMPELPNFSSGSGGSPTTSPRNSHESPEQSQSLPPQPLLQQVETKLRRSRLYRSRTLARPEDLESPRSSEGDRGDDLGGVLMTVCKDCKAMVLHIIVTWKKRRDRSKRASAPARPRSLFIAAVR